MTDQLDANTIAHDFRLQTQLDLPHILVFDTLPSTNQYLLEQAVHFPNKTVVCLADQQTAGRGRRGNAWSSPAGSNIYCSVLWHTSLDASLLGGMNLVTGISIAEMIADIDKSLSPQLKWPNDVYLNEKKLAGILIEMVPGKHSNCSLVIGIGININMPAHGATEINQPWTDLYACTSAHLSRNTIIAILLTRLLSNLITFTTRGAETFVEKWQPYDYLLGKSIRIATENGIINGTAEGVDASGQLRLKATNNQVILINSGDASIIQ